VPIIAWHVSSVSQSESLEQQINGDRMPFSYCCNLPHSAVCSRRTLLAQHLYLSVALLLALVQTDIDLPLPGFEVVDPVCCGCHTTQYPSTLLAIRCIIYRKLCSLLVATGHTYISQASWMSFTPWQSGIRTPSWLHYAHTPCCLLPSASLRQSYPSILFCFSLWSLRFFT